MMRRHVTKSRRCEMGCEAVGAGSPASRPRPNGRNDFAKAVYYPRRGRLGGVLLWRVWEKVDAASGSGAGMA